MKNLDFIKAMEAEIERLTTEYQEIGADMRKNGYDFDKSSRATRLNHTIGALRMAIKEYKGL